MSQMKVVSWTNAATALARAQDVGFTVAEITTVDTTNGGSWYWNSSMAAASYLDVDSGAITTTNGFTALDQGAVFGAAISGFTNANPGVITASYIGTVGIVAGDTITVAGLADDGTATSLNGSYRVASVTGTTITTGTNTSAYSVYVSGGTAYRVSDSNGDAVATQNVGILGITIGTGPVGANSAAMVAVIKGANSVV